MAEGEHTPLQVGWGCGITGPNAAWHFRLGRPVLCESAVKEAILITARSRVTPNAEELIALLPPGSEQKAEYIVRAVNAHDELLSVLQAFMDAWGTDDMVSDTKAAQRRRAALWKRATAIVEQAH